MLEEHGTLKRFKDGQVIFKEDDSGKEMYIVRRGRVEIFRSSNGQEVVLATLKPNDFFGEMIFFGDHKRSASARAKGDSEIQIVDKDTFFGFINEPIVWEILERLGQRIKEVDDKIQKLALEDQSRKEHLKTILSRNWDF